MFGVGAGSGVLRTLPIIERWDGLSWSRRPFPEPAACEALGSRGVRLHQGS